MTSERMVEFVWLPTFERASKKLRVYMILAYGKGQKETLTRKEEHELRKLASDLKKENC